MDKIRQSSSRDDDDSSNGDVETPPIGHNESVIDLTRMAEMDDTVIASVPESDSSAQLRPREYQKEMLEESLRRNIIVAMDTGSGKTQIAVLRIAAELEHCPPDQLVWFLAPSVALCQQQYAVIVSQLPAFQSRFLSGADNVEFWSEQWMWDAILQNVRVVVSTHQILLDALVHGFVRMSRLALLVFDEAHWCVRSHPANRIMRDFYHPILRNGCANSVPHILGLTASPVINASAGGLNTIEQNLNAISKTPKVHRQEMLLYVHPPVFKNLFYPSYLHGGSMKKPISLTSLSAVYQGLDIHRDPYIIELKLTDSDEARRKLQKALIGRKTYCQDQMKSLHSRSLSVYAELGAWAVDYYIFTCITGFRDSIATGSELFFDGNNEEKTYLCEVLSSVEAYPVCMYFAKTTPQVSPKVEKFIQLLIEENVPSFAGITFVQERATVAVLLQLLCVHPHTRQLIACGSFVGTSQNINRTAANIGELVEARHQKETLDDLRNGKKNLIIATSVLEEGIDVSACHIVICFSKPANLKSFIQRRGRARKTLSTFVLMLEENNDSAAVEKWRKLEEEMILAYQDEMRQLEAIRLREDTEEENDRTFRVSTTGALLSHDNAMAHLYHFCATLPASPYVDLRPEFVVSENTLDGSMSAQVILPISVDPSVREAESSSRWITEREAKKDAAFEAYVKLYHAGLLNDNLLPLRGHDADQLDGGHARKKVESLVQVKQRLNPWTAVAQRWLHGGVLFPTRIKVQSRDEPEIAMTMLTPWKPPQVPMLSLHWNERTIYTISAASHIPVDFTHSEIDLARDVTHVLLSAVFQSRMAQQDRDFLALFTPVVGSNDLRSWYASVIGSRHAGELTVPDTTKESAAIGLIRDMTRNGLPHILQSSVLKSPGTFLEEPSLLNDPQRERIYLMVTRLPKRADFLHGLPNTGSGYEAYTKTIYLPASSCTVDNLPLRFTRFALFIPSIIHTFEISMVAQELCDTVLPKVLYTDLRLVVTAISASSAREATNYQRFEFLGDSILKLSTSVQLLAEHQNWHEGYLSARKDELVANSRLAQSAQEIGLDRFILTTPFTGKKWRPSYITDLLRPVQESTRETSTKVLADVVEALIGAAYIDGATEKALTCIAAFLPEVHWLPIGSRHSSLFDAVTADLNLPPHFQELEKLVGYTFQKKTLLIEAMTHASCTASLSSMSYQRLEFLGDAVLDNVVVTQLFRQGHEISHYKMHLIRTALVNADFLAFLCMEWSIEQERVDITVNTATGKTHSSHTIVPVQFWRFMRHSSPAIAKAQAACIQQHSELRVNIQYTLLQEKIYPWGKLAQLQADKFFSDIVESLLGAIYIDSFGDMTICEEICERLGILPYLRRIIDDDIHLLHPKEHLGQVADTEKVEYVIGLEDRGDGSGKCYWCVVKVGEREVVRVSDGVSRFEVQTRAADVATRILLDKKI
ncbi:MAG: Dicer-like protein 2 [Pycnora praestabilis]|nr:MAG: Dicer-like protein 2 [Pycnora praestabilis]